jgi:glycosyltransferase involved in cell wall biosynthesis
MSDRLTVRVGSDGQMTSTQQPTVSIGVPVYNGEGYLAEMLESLLAQTFGDFEIVISDNASTDGTAAIARAFAARDPRVRVHTSAVNRGAGWNFNRVLELSSGRYFKWQAHDDIVSPTFLEHCVGLLDRDPSMSVASTGVVMVDAGLRTIEHYGVHLDLGNPDPVERFREVVLRWHLCYEVFGVIRRSALDRTAGMGGFSHGDGVLLAHLALLGPYGFVDQPLFLSRQHEQQSMKQFGHEGGGNDYRRYAVWFDPALEGVLTMPNWRISREFAEVVLAVPMPALDRLRCALIVARRMRWDARLLVKDLLFASRWVVARLLRPRVSGRRGS